MPDPSKILAAIAATSDADRLRQFRENAIERDAPEVAEAAFRRLIEVVPAEAPGTLEHDFFSMVAAFEEYRRLDRGKKVPMNHTRRKVDRLGVRKTLVDFTLNKKPTVGFVQLMEWGMPELTGEAIVLRHQADFDEDVVAAARRRLEDADVDVERVLRRR